MTRRGLPYLLSLAFVAATALALLAMGRAPICECGHVALWGVTGTAGGSQHVADWYTPSHLLHGLIFFALLWLVARRLRPGWRLAIAVAVEGLWEIAENSDAMIERYRTVTIALGYRGDSVVNSVADIAAMALGFWLAGRLPVWVSVAMVVGFELLTLVVIRDGLALNVLMLLHPVEAVRAWQQGG